VIARDLAKTLKSLGCLLLAVLTHQPQRTLVEEETTDEQNSSGDDLNCHGDTPCRRRGGVHVLVDAIVDPESDQRAGLVGYFEKTSQDTADGNDGELGDVAGDCGGDGTTCDSCEGTTGVWSVLDIS
jgi:hypothetical protein